MHMRACRWILALAVAKEARAEAASPVVTLSSANFDGAVLDRPELWVVDFYAPVSYCSVVLSTYCHQPEQFPWLLYFAVVRPLPDSGSPL